MGHLGAFLFLLGTLGAVADICVIPQADSQVVKKLGQRLLPWMDRVSPEHLNPSLYLGLRLSSLQAGAKEDLYLHGLKLDYQQCLLRSDDDNDNSECQTRPSMGQLAVYLLALRANCEFVGGRKGDKLVSQLKWFLEDEKKAIGNDHSGQPHSSYYQYGLSILALCVHQKRVHNSVVGKLLYAVEHDHLHQGHLSVDTLAMAGLAFSCLERMDFNPEMRQRIATALGTVRGKILQAQTPEGHLGNVYSTPLALQLLRASSPEPGAELGTVCLKAGTALLASIKEGAFQNVLMISQLLPVLNRKTYLDLIHPECQAPRVMLVAPPEDPAPIHDPATISVTLKVNSVLPPYKQAIAVPAGSSLEDVLKKAQKLGGFTYGTQASLSGPYLTSVKGKTAGHREFWQLLRDPDTPLQQGIADYRPQDGETVELRLVSW